MTPLLLILCLLVVGCDRPEMLQITDERRIEYLELRNDVIELQGKIDALERYLEIDFHNAYASTGGIIPSNYTKNDTGFIGKSTLPEGE